LADRGDWRYGIDQPAGGTMNAAKLAVHGGTGDGIALLIGTLL
jgi:hypothetical protein